MRCEWFREALSARVDGEAPGIDEATIDAHLAACDGCREWPGAHALARATRIAPAEPGLDLVDGHAVPAHEAAHGLETAGLGLLWALARWPARPRRGRTGQLRLA